MKKTLCILLSTLVMMSAFTIFGASAKVIVKNKTMNAYTKRTYILKKPVNRKYKFKIKNNNKKYIGVKLKNNKKTFKLVVTAKKPTKKVHPVVTLYYVNSKKKVVNKMRLNYTVNPMKKLTFKDRKMNKQTSRKITLNNPYAYEYELKASKAGIVKVPKNCAKNGTKRTYSFKALKKGSTNIEIYFKGTKKLVGEFKITSGDFKTVILPKYKTLTFKYNSHGSSVYMTESHINVKDILGFKHAGAVYSATVKDESVASVVSDRVVYATGKGSTSVKIYEERNGKTKKVGTVQLNCKKASMRYVAIQNSILYDGQIFGNGDNTVFLDLKSDKTTTLSAVIKERLLNNILTASEFNSSEYKISYKSSNTKIAKVSSKGKVTARKKGTAKITCTLSFSDKTKYKAVCTIIVE